MKNLNKNIYLNFLNKIIPPYYFYSFDNKVRILFSNNNNNTFQKNIENAVKISNKIYEYFFLFDFNLILIYDKFCYRKQKIHKKNLITCSLKTNDYKIEFKKLKANNFFIKNSYWHRLILSCKSIDIDYIKILRKICEQDFDLSKKRFKGKIFFFNPDKNLIFHVYDDRGAILISKNKELIDNFLKKNTFINYQNI